MTLGLLSLGYPEVGREKVHGHANLVLRAIHLLEMI
jgi:hypothetical protein